MFPLANLSRLLFALRDVELSRGEFSSRTEAPIEAAYHASQHGDRLDPHPGHLVPAYNTGPFHTQTTLGLSMAPVHLPTLPMPDLRSC